MGQEGGGCGRQTLQRPENHRHEFGAGTREAKFRHQHGPGIHASSAPRIFQPISAMPFEKTASEVKALLPSRIPPSAEGHLQLESDQLGEHRGNRVADLPQTYRWLSCEPKPVRERLDPGSLAHRECPVLLGVDVPVAVLCDVRRDTSADLTPGETLVLVREDVTPVAAKVIGQIDVRLPLLEQCERLRVVRTNITCDVVVHERSVRASYVLTHPPLEVGPRP